MGLNHSPRIVTDSLAYHIDTNNIKSYKGPAIQNLLYNIDTPTWNQAGLVFTPSTEIVTIPTVGTVSSVKTTGYNNYPAVSTGCCPNLYSYADIGYLDILPSTLYTYAILYKTTSGYSHPNFMYRYEYTSAIAYVTEAGIHSTTNRIHLGDGWYWAWATFTTQATTAKFKAFSFYYQYGTTNDTMYVADVLLAKGDHTKLHPIYWPDLNTTRSNTNLVLDMTNMNTTVAGNLSYANTGTIQFTGANSRIDTSVAVNFANNTTWEAWVNRTSSISAYNMFMGTGLPYFGLRDTYNDIIFSNYISGTQRTMGSTGITIQNNTWYHIACTTAYNGSNTDMKIYVNGQLNSNGSYTGNQSAYNTRFSVGDGTSGYWYPFNGQISNVKIYNKTLSDTEIKQNFNALRGRYGL